MSDWEDLSNERHPNTGSIHNEQGSSMDESVDTHWGIVGGQGIPYNPQQGDEMSPNSDRWHRGEDSTQPGAYWALPLDSAGQYQVVERTCVALPFGYTNAPFIWTKVIKVLAQAMRTRGFLPSSCDLGLPFDWIH
jgi:hypothetical protein